MRVGECSARHRTAADAHTSQPLSKHSGRTPHVDTLEDMANKNQDRSQPNRPRLDGQGDAALDHAGLPSATRRPDAYAPPLPLPIVTVATRPAAPRFASRVIV